MIRDTKLDDSRSEHYLATERLRLATHSANIGVWDFDPQTGVLVWDDRCRAAFGLSPDAPVDWGVFLAGLHPDDRARTEQAVEASLDAHGSGLYRIEYRTVGLQDRVERWVLAEGQAYFFDEGRVERFIGTVLDITARKRTEEALARKERRYRSLIEATTQIIWDTRPDGSVCNPQPHWAAFTGQTYAETDGWGWLEAIHPDDRRETAQAFRDCLRTLNALKMEHRLRRHDNVYRYMAVRAAPVIDPDGTVREWIGVHSDITERREAEMARDALLARQRNFIREVLLSTTDDCLHLCDTPADLPDCLTTFAAPQVLSTPRLRDFRHTVAAAAREADLPQSRLDDLITATGEAAMNAVVHAGVGEGEICLDKDRGLVQVWVRDTGRGISESSLHRAILEKGFTTAGTLGHGFWMMVKTAARVYLLTGPAGTTIVLEQDKTSPEPLWMTTK